MIINYVSVSGGSLCWITVFTWSNVEYRCIKHETGVELHYADLEADKIWGICTWIYILT